MHPYASLIRKILEQHANPADAAPMKKYMRNQFEFLGIKTPVRVDLMKSLVQEHGLPLLGDLDVIVRELWSLPQREFQYTAVGLIGRLETQLEPSFITALEDLIITKSWWDTVDTLAGNTVGVHFKRFPKVRGKYLKKWRKSDYLWLRRTAILFQLGYKKETDFDLLCEIVRENLGSDEFFINKAIGWALRQYAWTNPTAVKKFVKATKELHPLSRREALKNIGG